MNHLETLRDAANRLIDRLEDTQSQRFYDQVKPEMEALIGALELEVQTPFGTWRYDRHGEPIAAPVYPMNDASETIALLVETMVAAIKSGEWKADGANDPNAALLRATRYLERRGYVSDGNAGETWPSSNTETIP